MPPHTVPSHAAGSAVPLPQADAHSKQASSASSSSSIGSANAGQKRGPRPGQSAENGEHPVVMSSGVAFTPSAWQGQFWRIGNKFYDLTPFLDKHPGGRALLELSRDRFDDSTFAFEAHHHNQAKVRKMLAVYEVRGVVPPQSSDSNRRFPNLIPDDDSSFFSDFRRRVTRYLAEHHGGDWGPTAECMRFFWFWVAAWCVCTYVSVFGGYLLAAVAAGLVSAVLGGFGHSFVHQPKYRWHALSLDISGCAFRLGG
jgi:hypothetical protein